MLGIYRPFSTRDAASVERDGHVFAECNLLSGGEVEVRFADGQWMLARPEDLVPAFHLESYPGEFFIAQRYGSPWNGFATPVVDRFTLDRLLAVTGEGYRTVVAPGGVGYQLDADAPGQVLVPGADGLYDLMFLGWTFLEVDLGC